MNKTMQVIVNGKPETRPVSHQQKNATTFVWEDVPVCKAGETIQRDSNGVVYIYGGAHQ